MNGKKTVSDFPNLMKEWDFDNNTNLDPFKASYGSNKTVSWKCLKCNQKWKSKINNRTVLNRGCPVCANKKIVIGINDLATTHPNIAKEWDYKKNDGLTPYMVTHGSGKKVYWLCEKGHSFKTTVLHRASGKGTGCPECIKGRQTSFAEQAVYYYVKKEFPDAINRYQPSFLNRMELDIYIPSRTTAIEYDGLAWHRRGVLEREQRKYNLCKKNGIKLIRIREDFPDLGSDIADYMFGNNAKLYEPKNLDDVILQLLKHLTFKTEAQILKEVDINTERDEKEIRKYMTTVKGSLLEKNPALASEWDCEKNGDITPDKVFPGSDQKYYWKCATCGKSYLASVSHRSHGTGCPNCAIRKSAIKRSLKVEMVDPNDNRIIKVYDSISDAARDNNINDSNISTVCKGHRKKAGGYIWRYHQTKKSR